MCDESTFNGIFTYSQDDNFRWKCDVKWNEINFSVQSDKIDEINKETNLAGKNDVIQQAVVGMYEKLQEHEQYLAKLLVKIPLAIDPKQLLTSLDQFFKSHNSEYIPNHTFVRLYHSNPLML